MTDAKQIARRLIKAHRESWLYNVAVTPLVIARAPILLTSLALAKVSGWLWTVGDVIPGWRR